MQEESKKELLSLAEKITKESVESAFKVTEIEIKASKTPLDDMLLVAFPQVKAMVLKAVDKINGEVN